MTHESDQRKPNMRIDPQIEAQAVLIGLLDKLLAFARGGSYEHQTIDMHEVINKLGESLTRLMGSR